MDEAFALSPISARAAQPSEGDYEAIRDAFMETSRGRWFLGEYAKRNRNADTTMVLDAVARIEETLAAQKPQPAPDRTPEVLQAIRRAVEAAEAAVGAALDRTTLDNGVAPIHRGIRIIKEISWRWREIGADGRICDLIDSQLTMIEGACEQITASDPRTELKAVFDLLRRAVEDSAAADGAESPPRAGSPATGMAAEPERAAAEDASAASEAGAILSESASLAEPAAVISETPSPAADRAEHSRDPTAVLSTHNSELEIPKPTDEAETALDGEQTSLEATAEAEDDAVLDLIALEMGALDEPDDFLDPVATAPGTEVNEVAVQELPAARQRADSAMVLPAGPGFDEIMEAAETAAELPRDVESPSLGSTILASGMLQPARTPANDPLAPIRRMTQAERIAFFS